jgi:2-dehydropantoate 2-reductase
MNKSKFLVIGLGPCGGIFAAYLAAAGGRVIGIDIWEEHCAEIKKRGLHITNLVSLQSPMSEVFTSFDPLIGNEFDYVVIAVKTPNLPEIVPELKKLRGNFKIVVLQNGLDNEEYFTEFFNRERILRVAVSYAGNIVSPGIIKMNFFQKPNHVGCICKERGCSHSDELASLMTDAGLDTDIVADIRKFTFRKAILNAILAPIAAVLGVTMADVMANVGTRELVESLTKESIEVAKAAGYDYGKGFFDECIGFLLNAGHHKPSMLIDIENGNPTEIDYINGKIAFHGNRLNIPVPFNTTMTALVKAKEQHKPKNDE